jgi:predicted ATPase/class 3 adenylate cyclase
MAVDTPPAAFLGGATWHQEGLASAAVLVRRARNDVGVYGPVHQHDHRPEVVLRAPAPPRAADTHRVVSARARLPPARQRVHDARMAELPRGTVTFLFTDVEGSTRLLQELGDAYAEVLAEHRRVLREAFTRQGGIEVDTQGDAFFVAFRRAADAVAAAAAAQDALAEAPLRVRMGVHTGEPLATADGYVGVDVHRAARIAAAGHGGQVLLSQSTRELVGPTGLRDLGEHWLKDFEAPERIWQLGEHEFPPLKTLYQTNLPVPATRFLGREQERREVAALLREHRLVTLTGPGGTGKTRLGLQVAAEAAGSYADGVYWVGLASLRDAALVVPTIAEALGVKDSLPARIGAKRQLLLLDNLEQLVDCAPELAALLGACPNLTLLVTSREPLRLSGERHYPVLPLREADAQSLFRERAHAFAAEVEVDGEVAEICRRLDHLPLAIELAAARVTALSPSAILTRLERRLPLLTGGARDLPERHRTLRATIDWSYELLSQDEQRTFAGLAVFTDGCALEPAEDVCGADLDTLQSLVERSLMRRTGDRFWMLETIREFANERLEELADEGELRERHARYFLALAEEAMPELTGSTQSVWFERLTTESGNMRAALTWGCTAPNRQELALRLAVALERFWSLRGQVAEGKAWFERALALGDAEPGTRGRALAAAADLARVSGDWPRARRLLDEGIAALREAGDVRAATLALIQLGLGHVHSREYETGKPLFKEALALSVRAGERRTIAVATACLANAALLEGDDARAQALFADALAIFSELEDTHAKAASLESLAILALRGGGVERAAELLAESLELAQSIDDMLTLVNAVEVVAALALRRHDPERACCLLGAGAALRARLDLSLDDVEEELHGETKHAAMTSLGSDGVAALEAEGAALALDGILGEARAALR